MHVLQKLISIPSQSGNESKIQAFIFNYLTELGFKPFYEEKNVMVKIPGINNAKAMLFDAHVDTVSPGDLDLWLDDPFGGKRRGDRVYGLGSSDNKASVASLLLLALHYSHHQPEVDVWLLFVVNEEVDGSGSKVSVAWFGAQHFDYDEVWAAVTEPTQMKRVEIGHRGNVFVSVTAHGKSGHGSKPLAIDDNAVLVMSKVALRLHALNEVWSKHYADSLFGSPTLGVGTSIIAGNSLVPNKFADTCSMVLDVRTIPSMHDKVLGMVQKVVGDLPASVGFAQEPASCGFTPENHALVRVVKEVMPLAAITLSPWSTDQCFFSEQHIAAVVMGPGIPHIIHQANEYCTVSAIDAAVKIFTSLIEKMSSVPDEKKLQ